MSMHELMMYKSRRLGLLALVAGGLAASASAQISRPTENELQAAPPQFQDLVHGRSDKINQSAAPKRGTGAPPGGEFTGASNPSHDAKDFSGFWARGNGPAIGGYRTAPGAGAADPRPGTVVNTRLDANRMCLVSVGVNLGEEFLGVKPARLMIYQSPTQITLIGNNELRARRVYFDAAHASHPVPSYNGDALAHWEGDTLVIDTIALKGVIAKLGFDVEVGIRKLLVVNPTLHVIERLHKSADGSQLIDEQTWEDSSVNAPPAHQTLVFQYAEPDSFGDWECEDSNDRFGPAYADGVS